MSRGSDGGSTSTASTASTIAGSSSAGTTPSITPCHARFSAVWTPSGKGVPLSASNTFGPRKPISAPGSPTVTCASEPQDA